MRDIGSAELKKQTVYSLGLVVDMASEDDILRRIAELNDDGVPGASSYGVFERIRCPQEQQEACPRGIR